MSISVNHHTATVNDHIRAETRRIFKNKGAGRLRLVREDMSGMAVGCGQQGRQGQCFQGFAAVITTIRIISMFFRYGCTTVKHPGYDDGVGGVSGDHKFCMLSMFCIRKS